ncbi:MAG TPA: hypothetical protein VHK27_05520 [Gammaproteobacteria bacterium]|nr:hypothetical protein [Gammaproteobacteria bacterium]
MDEQKPIQLEPGELPDEEHYDITEIGQERRHYLGRSGRVYIGDYVELNNPWKS